MKRLICLVVLLVVTFSFAMAESIDLSAMTEEELKTLREQIDAELLRRTYTAADYPAGEITGVWYLAEATVNGQKMDVSNTGVAMSMEIKPDNTLVLISNGMKNSGTWKQEGDVYILLGEEAVLSDGRLNIATDELSLSFSREPVDSTVPRTVSALSEDDFTGEWVLDKVGQNGIVVPASIAPEGMHFDIYMNIRQGKVSIEWNPPGLSWEIESSFADGRLTLLSDGQETQEISFSALEKTEEDGIMTVMSMKSGAEPVALYLKRDPLPADEGPIPYFGLKTGMSRTRIITRMNNQGMTLFEEEYTEKDNIADGSFAFYGKTEVFGEEPTAVVVKPGTWGVDYAYYFFDTQAEFRSRLTAEDARWYQADELKDTYDRLQQSMKNHFGEPGDYDGLTWKIDGTYYDLHGYHENSHMIILSVFH